MSKMLERVGDRRRNWDGGDGVGVGDGGTEGMGDGTRQRQSADTPTTTTRLACTIVTAQSHTWKPTSTAAVRSSRPGQ